LANAIDISPTGNARGVANRRRRIRGGRNPLAKAICGQRSKVTGGSAAGAQAVHVPRVRDADGGDAGKSECGVNAIARRPGVDRCRLPVGKLIAAAATTPASAQADGRREAEKQFPLRYVRKKFFSSRPCVAHANHYTSDGSAIRDFHVRAVGGTLTVLTPPCLGIGRVCRDGRVGGGRRRNERYRRYSVSLQVQLDDARLAGDHRPRRERRPAGAVLTWRSGAGQQATALVPTSRSWRSPDLSDMLLGSRRTDVRGRECSSRPTTRGTITPFSRKTTVRTSENSGKWKELGRPSVVLLIVVAVTSSCGQRTTLVKHDASAVVEAGPSAADSGAPDAFAGDLGGRVPKNHRPSTPACAAERGSLPLSEVCLLDGGARSSVCLRDSDCQSGKNGRCSAPNNSCSSTCSYDQCFADFDCGSGVPCNCRTSPSDFANNWCITGSNCVLDSNCGPGGYCSPSMIDVLGSCPGCGSGFFCHTSSDTCLNDSDCSAGVMPTCAYAPQTGRWGCATISPYL